MFLRNQIKIGFASTLFVVGTFAAGALAFSQPALLDFEKHPVEATGPSLFASAGPEADVTLPGVATVKGGLILGNETNLPALAFATPPNDYGTASASFIPGASSTLQSSLTVDVDPAYTCNEVSFTLLNGFTSSVTYMATAFDGSTQVGQQTFLEAANTSSGFHLYDLKASAITSVDIVPTSIPNGWDYSIDSVAFNQSIQQAVGGTPGVPLPNAAWTGLTTLTMLLAIAALKKRATKTAAC